MKTKFLTAAGFSALLLAVVVSNAFGQDTSDRKRRQVAIGNNIYCAGYVQYQPVDLTEPEIVGGEEEQEQHAYTDGDIIYLNAGAVKGVKVGDRFSVTRPRAQFRSVYSKKGKLGIFVQELGSVRVTVVKPDVSVAVVETACDTILFGDLLVPLQIERIAPDQRQEKTLDRFADPNGKANGKIVLARHGHELVTRDQIVYIDLGGEDGVKIGDYLTVYRPLGKGNLTTFRDDEITRSDDYGFESLGNRGGKFSNQAPRRKGKDTDEEIVSMSDAKKRRPTGLRKIVGEMVIISVYQRTATAVITRTVQEIITGDSVELQ